MNTTRRELLKSSGLALSFIVGAKTLLLTPAQAYAKQVPLRTLNKGEAAALEALAEALVPGAQAAGISHFIDSQLSNDAEKSLLMIRYLGVPAPHEAFYRSGLKSASQLAQSRYQKSLAELAASEVSDIIDDMAQAKVDDWQGPPSNFFFFVIRSDAADVVYGTAAGFERLEIPYMPHIQPEYPW